ncbi:MAG: FecR domain-containing protein [Clostridiales bacterium]|nr:FecR domain-containing protein [Clostridiales bacterium]
MSRRSVLTVRILALLTLILSLTLGALADESYDASAMRLVRYEGNVEILDAGGTPRFVMENVRFKSGEAMRTGEDGMASVLLDDEKIVTLDALSLVEFTKENSSMRLTLREGTLLLDVREKLDENETLDIVTSTMTVGIRGTVVAVSDFPVGGGAQPNGRAFAGAQANGASDPASAGVEAGQAVTRPAAESHDAGGIQGSAASPSPSGLDEILNTDVIGSVHGRVSVLCVLEGVARVTYRDTNGVMQSIQVRAGEKAVLTDRLGDGLTDEIPKAETLYREDLNGLVINQLESDTTLKARVENASDVLNNRNPVYSSEVVFTAGSAKRSLNGGDFNNSDLPVKARGLPEGFAYTAACSGELAEVGKSENAVTEYAIYDEFGMDVTGRFSNVRLESGLLTVTWDEPVTLIAQSASKMYNGEPLRRTTDVLVNGLPTGYSIKVFASGTQTDVGSSPNPVSSYTIFNSEGEEVTECFTNIQTISGKLVVDPAPLTVWTGSARKVYDGTPLYNRSAGVANSPNYENGMPRWRNLSYVFSEGTSGLNTAGDCQVLYGICGIVWVHGTNPITQETREIELHAGQKLLVYLHDDKDRQTIEFKLEDASEKELPEEILRLFADNPGLIKQACADAAWDQAELTKLINALPKLKNDKKMVSQAGLKVPESEAERLMTDFTNVRITIDTDITDYTDRALGHQEAHYSPVYIDETIKVSAVGSRTEVGSSQNGYTIKWGNANPKNYSLTEKLGTLTVEKLKLVFDLGSMKTDYTGSAATPEPVMTYANGSHAGETVAGIRLRSAGVVYRFELFTGDSVELTVKGMGAAPGTYELEAKAAFSEEGKKRYTASVKGTTMTVNPAVLTITTGSANKYYDGMALTCDEVSVEGLAYGDTVTVTATGTITDAGKAQNTYSIDWGDTNRNNYKVKASLGMLEVKPMPVTFDIFGTEEYHYVFDGEPIGPIFEDTFDEEIAMMPIPARGYYENGDAVELIDSTFGVDTPIPCISGCFNLKGGAEVYLTFFANTDAGTYTVTPQIGFVSGKAANYKIAYVNNTMVIDPLKIRVDLDSCAAYWQENGRGLGDGVSSGGPVYDSYPWYFWFSEDEEDEGIYAICTNGYYSGDILGPSSVDYEEDNEHEYSETATYSLPGNGGATVKVVSPVDAGTHKVIPKITVTAGKAANYDFSWTDTTLVVDPVTLTITLNGHESTFTNLMHLPRSATATLSHGDVLIKNCLRTRNQRVYKEGTQEPLYYYTRFHLVDTDKVELKFEGPITVGTYDLADFIKEVTFVSGNKNNYDIKYTDSEMTVTPLDVNLYLTEEPEVSYDGEFHGAEPYIGGYYWMTPSETQANTWDVFGSIKNEVMFRVKITGGGTDACAYTSDDELLPYTLGYVLSYPNVGEENFDIHVYNDELYIYPASLYITTGSASKVYDGTPLSNGDVEIEGLVNGDTITVATISITDADEVDNDFTIDWGTTNENNYSLWQDVGVLTVTPRDVEFDLGGRTVAYEEGTYRGGDLYVYCDGLGSTVEKQSDTVWIVTFASGDVAEVTITGGGTDPGVYTLECEYTFTAGSKDNFNISCVYDQLTVALEPTPSPVPLHISTGSASKLYDGTPLTNPEVNVEGLRHRDSVTVTATGSQTEVGKSDNTYDIDWGDTDEDGYYLEEDLGELEVISPDIPITITAGTASKAYDGTALTCDEISIEGLPDGFACSGSASGSQTKFGTSENAVGEYTITDITGKDVTSLFTNITEVSGTLTVTANETKITITADSFDHEYSVMYSGKLNSYTVDGLPEGYSVEATVEGMQYVAGTSDNVITAYVIKDGNGDDVTDCFGNVECVNGTLTVTKAHATIRTIGETKTYDGKPLSGCIIRYGGVAGLDDYSTAFNYTLTGSSYIRDAGSVELTFTASLRPDLEDKYVLDITFGFNTIEPAPLTIRTGSGEKVYDGTELISDEIEVIGLVEGETLTAVATGSQTEIGSSSNTYTLTWDGTAKESNYVIETEELGTLNVTNITFGMAFPKSRSIPDILDQGDADDGKKEDQTENIEGEVSDTKDDPEDLNAEDVPETSETEEGTVLATQPDAEETEETTEEPEEDESRQDGSEPNSDGNEVNSLPETIIDEYAGTAAESEEDLKAETETSEPEPALEPDTEKAEEAVDETKAEDNGQKAAQMPADPAEPADDATEEPAEIQAADEPGAEGTGSQAEDSSAESEADLKAETESSEPEPAAEPDAEEAEKAVDETKAEENVQKAVEMPADPAEPADDATEEPAEIQVADEPGTEGTGSQAEDSSAESEADLKAEAETSEPEPAAEPGAEEAEKADDALTADETKAEEYRQNSEETAADSAEPIADAAEEPAEGPEADELRDAEPETKPDEETGHAISDLTAKEHQETDEVPAADKTKAEEHGQKDKESVAESAEPIAVAQEEPAKGPANDGHVDEETEPKPEEAAGSRASDPIPEEAGKSAEKPSVDESKADESGRQAETSAAGVEKDRSVEAETSGIEPAQQPIMEKTEEPAEKTVTDEPKAEKTEAEPAGTVDRSATKQTDDEDEAPAKANTTGEAVSESPAKSPASGSEKDSVTEAETSETESKAIQVQEEHKEETVQPVADASKSEESGQKPKEAAAESAAEPVAEVIEKPADKPKDEEPESKSKSEGAAVQSIPDKTAEEPPNAAEASSGEKPKTEESEQKPKEAAAESTSKPAAEVVEKPTDKPKDEESESKPKSEGSAVQSIPDKTAEEPPKSAEAPAADASKSEESGQKSKEAAAESTAKPAADVPKEPTSKPADKPKDEEPESKPKSEGAAVQSKPDKTAEEPSKAAEAPSGEKPKTEESGQKSKEAVTESAAKPAADVPKEPTSKPAADKPKDEEPESKSKSEGAAVQSKSDKSAEEAPKAAETPKEDETMKAEPEAQTESQIPEA